MGIQVKGPWNIFITESGSEQKIVGVLSDDFDHDVLLRVDGDFESQEQKREYCNALIEKLKQK